METHPMDEFCGSRFWDLNLTWYTDDPDLTPCFQQTVLVWAPCAFLWLFSFLELYYLRKSANKDVPWSFVNVTKLLVIGSLIVLTIVDLAKAISTDGISAPLFYYTPVIKLASFIFVAILIYLNKHYGMRTSGLLFLFWFLLTVCSIPRVRTEIRAYEARIVEDSWAEYQFVSFLIFFSLTCIMFLLNFFVDKPPRQSKYEITDKDCPELAASFPSRIFFAWFDRLAWVGFRKPLEVDDLWKMKPEDSSKEVSPAFLHHWNETLEKTYQSRETSNDVTFKKLGNSARVDFRTTKAKNIASILPALIKTFGGTFLLGSFLKLGQDLLTFASPQILKLIIGFVGGEEPMWKGLMYAITLFVVAGTQTLLLGQYFNRMFFVGLRIRTALISAIYRKALIISNSARKGSTVGEIVNLMAVDAQRFMDLTTYINMIWSAPLQIGLALYFLWQILGPSVLAGLAVMIILIPVNGVIANMIKTLQIKQMKNKDERVKLMNEVLSGIKVLKLYAWEPSFEQQILKIRDKEVKVLKSAAYLNAGTSFIWSCAPFLVSLVTFATYVLVDENNVLDASTAFVSLSLFNILRFPLSMLPMLISNMVQTSVSVNRINTFLNQEELDPDNVQHDEKESSPLLIENGVFSWGGEETTLKNINVRVEKNQIVAVVGTVGSGKSSLLSAFLGEMDKISGRVNTLGRIAYVSQQAWIQNATLKDNILFGKPMDQRRYARVIEACALKPDIEMLPGGDMTEIGEKGINLSGGQKQRVSLARAVYNDADVYFLDDPLSAVDSHVGKHIFEQVIGPSGLLAKKTRVLVTHGITYLPNTDKIFVLREGEISESGTYQELMDKKGAFAEFLIQHLQEVSEEEEDLDEIKQQLENSVGGEELLNQLKRSNSKRSRSESTSETGSVKDISRQNSTTDSNTSLRRRTSEKAPEVAKTKLIEQEKSETGSVKWEVYKHYLKSIGLTLSVATVILNMIFQGFSIGSNLWLSRWSTDDTAGNDTSRRDMYLGVYGAFGAGQVLSTFLSTLFLYIGALEASRTLHKTLLRRVLHAPLTSFFDITPVGRVLNRFSKDIDTTDSDLPATLRAWSACFFGVVATLVVISISTPIFAAVIVPIGILYYAVQRFYVATSRQLKRLESVSRSPIYSHFGETIQGVQTIRAYSVQDRFILESDEKVDGNQLCYCPSIIANRWLAVRLEMVGNLIILFAALFAVLGRETMNAGLVGLSVSYALQITQTLNWLVRMTSDVETNIVAVERIKEYGETKQEAAWELPNSTLPRDWPEQGMVEFRDFQVRYREGLELVLRGISFTVNGGEKVGIVGRTGAGKSSLTLALFRIIESAGGSIVIDGQDISQLGLHALRSRLTIIPQDPVLFSGTLRINLDPFNAHSDDDIWKALEHAHLKSFVKGLTAGINHEVTEGGENLSVGQRQLICLARALLRKTKVLILDEATAAVDLETDDLIQRTIRTEFKDCTVLTIAHRLNTIMDSDKVIVLDKGQIVEFAPPAELLQSKNSAFYSMAKDAGLVKFH
ncbi:multidrug resistance-associated protein 1 isoform X1 [Anopheles merus]|uniref:multidrug resistance-associated protein 1 isoform X1 n=2 Tax=Anopheles merus TaxID=30066 RepID=UPI001BE44C46|nr:multidrug resistance-associated protein 1 isoform X1 [Anopheles merus]XP_041776321.1 multidrug resistance-associated protein 1 isoform X1 [Anopheles merus]